MENKTLWSKILNILITVLTAIATTLLNDFNTLHLFPNLLKMKTLENYLLCEEDWGWGFRIIDKKRIIPHLSTTKHNSLIIK